MAGKYPNSRCMEKLLSFHMTSDVLEWARVVDIKSVDLRVKAVPYLWGYMSGKFSFSLRLVAVIHVERLDLCKIARLRGIQLECQKDSRKY